MPIEEAREGVEIQPDHVYVLAPNSTLTVVDNFLHLDGVPVAMILAGNHSALRNLYYANFETTVAESENQQP